MIRQAKELNSRRENFLKRKARDVRIDVLKMIYSAGSGNPGGALSPVEILVWLYHHEMEYRKKDPRWDLRDRFILSKGQASPAYYSVFSQIGWIRRSEILTYRKINSRLQTHPEYNSIKGIDYTSGSLGQGLSAAVGMSLANGYLKRNKPRYFVLLGDGEVQEGQVWEAALSAGKYELGNIVVLLDNNGFQGDDSVEEVMPLDPVERKWESFGWAAKRVDGHDFNLLYEGLNFLENSGRPKILICDTIKGKGVSFMENNNRWHTAASLKKQFFKKAMRELNHRKI